jgi:hypothetical protein
MPLANTGSISGGNGGAGFKEQLPVLTNGDTVFVLSEYPADAAKFSLMVNGVAYHSPTAFTLTGNLVTWLNLFSLETSDELYAIFH